MIYNQNLTPTNVYTVLEKETNAKVVVKELRKVKMVNNLMHEFARNELAIHYSLSNFSKCSNIVKVKDYFEDEKSYYMVMECSPDPNFFEDLLENKYRPISDEGILKAYALDVLNGLVEIHKNSVIHCDIKPQNFLLFYNSESHSDSNISIDEDSDMSVLSYDPDSYLKITDFGLAHIIPFAQDKAYMKYKCGTFGYSAPEITKECFIDSSIDMWAFGISLYQMAVAYLPTAIKQYRYGSGPIPFRKIDWANFHYEEIKDLIENCLQIKPEERITASEALNHPWFETDN